MYLKPKDLIELMAGFLSKEERKVCLIEEAYGLN